MQRLQNGAYEEALKGYKQQEKAYWRKILIL